MFNYFRNIYYPNIQLQFNRHPKQMEVFMMFKAFYLQSKYIRITIYLLMGSLINKGKKKDKQKMIQPVVQEKANEPPPKQKEEPIQKHVTKRQKRPYIQQKRSLKFKNISSNQLQAIEQNPKIKDLLHSDRWLIQPQLIQHFRALNGFEYVEESPALALFIKLTRDVTPFIGNSSQLAIAKQQKQNNQITQPYRQYAIIYADLFSIKFSSLKKIKIRGPDKTQPQCIVSLQPLAKLNAPLLEQLSADSHPVTSLRFLRHCHWPRLSKLSIRANAVADSQEVANIMTGLTNSRHIQGIDLAGLYSSNWAQVSWIAKMSFADAEQQYNMLNKDDEYYYSYNNRVLRRVDCSLSNNKMRTLHVQMIKNKFNNIYFDNPISLW